MYMCCCCRGLKSSDNKYFSGKKRYTHIVMQGRFKHDVKASELWTGHEWFQITDLVPTRCVGAHVGIWLCGVCGEGWGWGDAM
jgi:hypothetical protein